MRIHPSRLAMLIGGAMVALTIIVSPAVARRASTAIEPYRGIAGVRLGMKMTDVYRVLGRPAWHDAEQMRYDDLGLVVRVAARDNRHPRRVWAVIAAAPARGTGAPARKYIHYRDPRGVGLGATRDDVRAVYPKRSCPDSSRCSIHTPHNADGLCAGYEFQFTWLKGQGTPIRRDPVQVVVISRCAGAGV
jgi:hypothetical protein